MMKGERECGYIEGGRWILVVARETDNWAAGCGERLKAGLLTGRFKKPSFCSV
jgi:hypothetical protein